MTAKTRFEPSNVNVRIKIAALWTSMLFVFAYGARGDVVVTVSRSGLSA